MQQPIIQREMDWVLGYIEQNIQGDVLLRPLPDLTELLLNTFGWPKNQGRKRAKQILIKLEKSGKIIRKVNGRNALIGVSLASLAVKAVQAPPKERPKLKEVYKPEKYDYLDPPKLSPPKDLKKGEARQNRQAEEKGERNERRLFLLNIRFVEILTQNFGSIVIKANVFQSGRHNPKKGKTDIQDHYGEDVVPQLTVRNATGGFRTERFILQSKSSYPAAKEFNENIKILPGQEGAALKKAYPVNPRRSDREIIAEEFDDMVAAGFLPIEIRERVLAYFSEYENSISA